MLLREESLSRKFITRGAWIYFFVFLTAPMGYIIRIILTGSLTPEEVGIIYWTMWLLAFLWSYTDFWLTESLNYFLPKYIIQSDYARAKYLLSLTMLTQIITSTLVSIGLYFWATWIADQYFHSHNAKEVIQIMSLYFIGNHVLQVMTTFMNAVQHTKILKTIDFIRMFMIVLWACILYFSGKGNLLTYSWIWLVWLYIALIIWSFIFYKRYYQPHLNLKEKKDLSLKKHFIQYSLGTLFSANVASVLHQADMQILTYFLWVYNTGIYSIYLSLIGIPFLFLWPIIAFLFPVLSEIGGKKEYEKVTTIFWLFSTYLGILGIWIWALYLMMGKELSWFLFWENFLSAGTALYFIAPFLIFNILMQINFQIMSGLWHIRKRISILLWALLINLIITFISILGFKYWFIPFPSGSSAASFSVGISWVFMWYMSYRAIIEYTGGFNWQLFFKNLIVILIILIIFQKLESSLSFTFWLWGRLQFLPQIGFAFIGSLGIFLAVNFSQIGEFIQTIKNVRKGTL